MNEHLLTLFQNRVNEIPSIIHELDLNPSMETFERLQIPIHDFPHIDIHKALIEFSINKKYNEINDNGWWDFQGNLVVDILGSVESDDLILKGIRKYQGGVIIITPRLGTFVIYGEIYLKWLALGGTDYGYPIIDEVQVGDDLGSYQHFNDKSIYFGWHSGGAFSIQGDIKDKWASFGGQSSALGYPTTDESITPDTIGRYNHFEFGSIYYHPNYGAFALERAIRDKWASLGWERSFLGYPITDKKNSVVSNGGEVVFFEKGQILVELTGNVEVIADSITYHDRQGPGHTFGNCDFAISSDGNWAFKGSMTEEAIYSDNASYSVNIDLRNTLNKIIYQEESAIIFGTLVHGNSTHGWSRSGYDETIKNHWELIKSVGPTFTMSISTNFLSNLAAIGEVALFGIAFLLTPRPQSSAPNGNGKYHFATDSQSGDSVERYNYTTY
jgi:LGFP repeat